MNETSLKAGSEMNIKMIVLIGFMTAIICVMGPLSIPLPFSPVPISLTNLAIYLTLYVIGTKRGTLSYLIYLLIGFIGVPVFSGFTSGPGKLLGPTGGYLIGFIFMAFISGFFIEKWVDKLYMHFIGMVVGTLICYLFGTAGLAYQAGLSFFAALAAGVIPFVPGDLVKIFISIFLGTQLNKRIKAFGLNN